MYLCLLHLRIRVNERFVVPMCIGPVLEEETEELGAYLRRSLIVIGHVEVECLDGFQRAAGRRVLITK